MKKYLSFITAVSSFFIFSIDKDAQANLTEEVFKDVFSYIRDGLFFFLIPVSVEDVTFTVMCPSLHLLTTFFCPPFEQIAEWFNPLEGTGEGS